MSATRWAVPVARDVLLASGPDTTTYLQGQLSQDVAALEVGASAFSLLLAPQGHLVAFVRITRTGVDDVVLDTDAGAGEAVLARLRRFLLRTRCELSTLPWSCLAVRGGSDGGADDVPAGTWRVVAETPGTPGYDLLGLDPAPPAGVVAGDPAAYEALRIERGVPRMGTELSEKTIPAEAGIVDRSASFTKGCYTGQELVARVDSRGGNTPRKLRGVVLEGTEVPPPGAVVAVAGTDVGAVTSAAWSPGRGAPVALAYAKRGTDVPSSCTVSWAGGAAAGHLTELPLD